MEKLAPDSLQLQEWLKKMGDVDKIEDFRSFTIEGVGFAAPPNYDDRNHICDATTGSTGRTDILEATAESVCPSADQQRDVTSSVSSAADTVSDTDSESDELSAEQSSESSSDWECDDAFPLTTSSCRFLSPEDAEPFLSCTSARQRSRQQSGQRFSAASQVVPPFAADSTERTPARITEQELLRLAFSTSPSDDTDSICSKISNLSSSSTREEILRTVSSLIRHFDKRKEAAKRRFVTRRVVDANRFSTTETQTSTPEPAIMTDCDDALGTVENPLKCDDDEQTPKDVLRPLNVNGCFYEFGSGETSSASSSCSASDDIKTHEVAADTGFESESSNEADDDDVDETVDAEKFETPRAITKDASSELTKIDRKSKRSSENSHRLPQVAENHSSTKPGSSELTSRHPNGKTIEIPKIKSAQTGDQMTSSGGASRGKSATRQQKTTSTPPSDNQEVSKYRYEKTSTNQLNSNNDSRRHVVDDDVCITSRPRCAPQQINSDNISHYDVPGNGFMLMQQPPRAPMMTQQSPRAPMMTQQPPRAPMFMEHPSLPYPSPFNPIYSLRHPFAVPPNFIPPPAPMLGMPPRAPYPDPFMPRALGPRPIFPPHPLRAMPHFAGAPSFRSVAPHPRMSAPPHFDPMIYGLQRDYDALTLDGVNQQRRPHFEDDYYDENPYGSESDASEYDDDSYDDDEAYYESERPTVEGHRSFSARDGPNAMDSAYDVYGSGRMTYGGYDETRPPQNIYGQRSVNPYNTGVYAQPDYQRFQPPLPPRQIGGLRRVESMRPLSQWGPRLSNAPQSQNRGNYDPYGCSTAYDLYSDESGRPVGGRVKRAQSFSVGQNSSNARTSDAADVGAPVPGASAPWGQNSTQTRNKNGKSTASSYGEFLKRFANELKHPKLCHRDHKFRCDLMEQIQKLVPILHWEKAVHCYERALQQYEAVARSQRSAQAKESNARQILQTIVDEAFVEIKPGNDSTCDPSKVQRLCEDDVARFLYEGDVDFSHVTGTVLLCKGWNERGVCLNGGRCQYLHYCLACSRDRKMSGRHPMLECPY